MWIDTNVKLWAAVMVLYAAVISITMTTAANHRPSSVSRPQVRGVTNIRNRVRTVQLLNGSSRYLSVGKENDDEKEDDDATKKEKSSSNKSSKVPKTPPDEGSTDGDEGATEKTKSKKGSKGGKSKSGKESGTEEVPIVYKRDVPPFTLEYTIDGKMGRSTPTEGDYNELSVVSEEFLDSVFRAVFEDLEVTHDATRVFVLLGNDEPFTVDFKARLDFVIPGEVPTVGFLIDRIRESFERDASSASYLFDLNAMSETNPFSSTTSFRLVDRAIPSSLNDGEGGTSSKDSTTESSKKKYVLITVCASIGFLILLGILFLWRRQTPKLSTINEMDNGAVSSRDEYNADEETMRYLNTIRKRYQDEEDHENSMRSAFDDVILPETETGTIALTPLDASFRHDVDDRNNPSDTYEHFTSLQNVNTTLHGADLAQINSVDNESNFVDQYKAKDFDYLGMELTNASFEDEDLRSIN